MIKFLKVMVRVRVMGRIWIVQSSINVKSESEVRKTSYGARKTLASGRSNLIRPPTVARNFRPYRAS